MGQRGSEGNGVVTCMGAPRRVFVVQAIRLGLTYAEIEKPHSDAQLVVYSFVLTVDELLQKRQHNCCGFSCDYLFAGISGRVVAARKRDVPHSPLWKKRHPRGKAHWFVWNLSRGGA